VVDGVILHRPLFRLQLQAELLLQSVEYRRTIQESRGSVLGGNIRREVRRE
jgi:hypothetical protein